MKKIILLGLIAIGAGAAAAPAQAGGLSVRVAVNPFCLPVVLPPPPILAPVVVVPTGCARPLIVRGGDYGVYHRGYGYGWYGHRVFERRDAHFLHGRY